MTNALPSRRSTRRFERPARAALRRTISAYSGSISRPNQFRSPRAAAAARRNEPLPTPISISTGAARPKTAEKSTTPASSGSPGRKILGGGIRPELRGPAERGVRGGVSTPARRRARRMDGLDKDRPRDRHHAHAHVALDARLAAEAHVLAELVGDLVRLDGRKVLGVEDARDAARGARAAAAADVADRDPELQRDVEHRPAGGDVRPLALVQEDALGQRASVQSFAATARANCCVVAVPPMSWVLAVPCSRAEKRAFSTRRAHASSPRWRSIITAERRSAVGFATPLPAMSGAEPCTDSKTAHVSPRFAPGVTPSPPTRPEARSLMMSP